jgi:hypothetical protein
MAHWILLVYSLLLESLFGELTVLLVVSVKDLGTELDLLPVPISCVFYLLVVTCACVLLLLPLSATARFFGGLTLLCFSVAKALILGCPFTMGLSVANIFPCTLFSLLLCVAHIITSSLYTMTYGTRTRVPDKFMAAQTRFPDEQLNT